jgi:NAD(P)H-dependent FMN reductase
MQQIGVILASTRQQRFGEAVARWVMQNLPADSTIHFELLDLRTIVLPFYDEPQTPDTLGGKYTGAAAQQWHDSVAACTGFVIITPEYNHSYPAVLKNAIDYLCEPWQGKPFVIVSYSPGAIGGARSAEQVCNLLNYMGARGRGELNIAHAKKRFDATGAAAPELTERLHKLFTKLIN